ncbi:YqzL family protein [Virgibacillus sp. C22-A2]|uniref:YqzL family protein n=1 Tax=Virgibacillus tibetensis TaxID=3042313 RepID=A0ABU6KCP1_9BACI|nr:YqzL family protein [Virgibacillus sp. C22-A2]
MVDLTWRIFSQTGNIETYLLMKELENEPNSDEHGQSVIEEISPLDTKI